MRYQHFISLPYKLNDNENTYKFCGPEYFIETCNKFSFKNILFHLCNHNIIYPWEIEEYGKLGINNFKLVSRDLEKSVRNKHIDYYLTYLKGIEDYKTIANMPIKIFNHYFVATELDYKVKDVKQYLPNIEYFKEHGHLCATECGVECRYCYKCAENIKNIFQN